MEAASEATDNSNPLYALQLDNSQTLPPTIVPIAPIVAAPRAAPAPRPSRAPVRQGTGNQPGGADTTSTVSTQDRAKSTKATLHAKLGGPAAVSAAVDVFYKKVLADEALMPFFENIDMLTLVAKQNRFLAYAFGATSHYHGKDIVMGHAHLILNKGLDLTHFDRVAGHFVDTLQELKVSQDLIDQAASVLMGVRPLFDPVRYRGKLDVEKLVVAAAPPPAKNPSGQAAGPQKSCGPECCAVM